MKCLFLVLSALTLSMECMADAAFFNGVYEAENEGGARLTLNQDSNQVQGYLEAFGVTYRVQGVVESDVLTGTLSGGDEYLSFRAEHFQEGVLSLLVADPEMVALGLPPQPVYFRVESTAVLSEAKDDSEPETTITSAVRINGRALSAEQVKALSETYGQTPVPGDYWYDALSGLYGVRGYQAFGFMLPGHDFGPLEEAASVGDSGVFVNGRHIPQMEWMIWSQLLGYPIQWGRYWLDAQGNAGYEGNPVPVENLYLAAQRNAVAAGEGGDNFWTSRFSAGNSDQGNTRGYVSVPGHGPVGYGF